MDGADIHQLRDVAVPEVPPLWPLAPGLNLLLCCLLWGLLCAAWWVYQRRKASAYRRAGIILLEQSQSLRELSAVLKRVAMVSYGREAVASLYGAEWVEFLHRGCAGVDLQALVEGEEINAPLRCDAAKWIRQHR